MKTLCYPHITIGVVKKGPWILGFILAVVAAYLGIDMSADGGQTPTASSSQTAPSAQTTPSEQTASSSQTAPSGAFCPIDSLPKEARQVTDSIESGGPYAFPGDDNTHFGNYQNRLPKENSQYYREFTVPTPGTGHRGERRIVVGGGTRTDPDTWYYTGDHYDTFCEIPDAED